MFQVIILRKAEGNRAVRLPADELLQKGVGVGSDFVRGSLGDNLSLAGSVSQHEHMSGNAKAASHIVAYDYGGDADLASAIEGQLVDHGGHDRVESRGGFVTEQKFRIESEGAGEADPFSHSSAQFGRFKILKTSEANKFELHFDDHFDEGRVDLAMFEKGKGDIFADGHRLKEGTELEVHSKTEPDPIELLRGCLRNILPEKVDRSRGGFLGADENPEKGGFSATAPSHNDKSLAFADFEIQAVEDGPTIVRLNKILHFEDHV